MANATRVLDSLGVGSAGLWTGTHSGSDSCRSFSRPLSSCPSAARLYSCAAASTSGREPALKSDFFARKVEGHAHWGPGVEGFGCGVRESRSGARAAFDLPPSPRRGERPSSAEDREGSRTRSGPFPLRATRQSGASVPTSGDNGRRQPAGSSKGLVKLERVANGRAVTRSSVAAATRLQLPGIAGIRGRGNVTVVETQTTPELEQLQMESGLCVAFKKYTPESVRQHIFSRILVSILKRKRQSWWGGTSFLALQEAHARSV